jgi:hypothetical protein
MSKLSSAAVEAVNRNALVTVALKCGYNAYLPVCDEGIDLILHNEATGDTRLVQQKARWTIDKKYIGRNLWIAFPHAGVWYVVPHDVLLSQGVRHTESLSWQKGTYSKGSPSKQDLDGLVTYRFGSPEAVMEEASEASTA